jgi:predicted amidohydrolase YtcJ
MKPNGPSRSSDQRLCDPVTGDIPIFVERYDGHEALANSAAMKLAGIDAKTPDVPGGVIMRDASGNPTGIFKDAAMPLIYKAIAPMTHEQRLGAARGALKHAASLGVTSVQHMNPEFADVAAYSGARRKRRAHRAHLRGADGNGLARPGESWDSSRLGLELSATRRSQRLCRWIVRLANLLICSSRLPTIPAIADC